MASDRERTSVLCIHLYKSVYTHINHMHIRQRLSQETLRFFITRGKVHINPEAASESTAQLSAPRKPASQYLFFASCLLPTWSGRWSSCPVPTFQEVTPLAPHPALCPDKHLTDECLERLQWQSVLLLRETSRVVSWSVWVSDREAPSPTPTLLWTALS